MVKSLTEWICDSGISAAILTHNGDCADLSLGLHNLGTQLGSWSTCAYGSKLTSAGKSAVALKTNLAGNADHTGCMHHQLVMLWHLKQRIEDTILRTRCDLLD